MVLSYYDIDNLPFISYTWVRTGTCQRNIYFCEGNVGICTTDPQCKLQVNGYVCAIGFKQTSDERVKTNIENLDNQSCYDIINNLQVKKFNYNVDNFEHNDKKNYGLIAQESLDVIPETIYKSAVFIPNINKNVKYNIKNDNVTLENHGLLNGSVLKFEVNNKEFITSVKNVIDNNNFTITSKLEKNLKNEYTLYGTRVDDFLSIDYSQVSVVAIGAIQYLNKKIESIEEKVQFLLENKNF